jgi:hypothetical protein
MEIQTKQFSQQVNDLTKSVDKEANGPAGQTVSDLTQLRNNAKKQLNAAILQSTINVSASNSPQSLVLKTALAGINDALKGTLGDNAIQTAVDAGLNVSPDATAERIVSLSTAFFSGYQQQHPELSEQDALTKFTTLIGGGIDHGFSEARDILSGLSVLNGDVASNIDSTYALVQEKLSAFVENFNSSDSTAKAE